MKWVTILVVLAIIAGLLAALRFLPPVQGSKDSDSWKRAMAWVENHQESPAGADELSELKSIIRGIATGKQDDEARAVLISLYALGAMNSGDLAEGRTALRVLERDFPDSRNTAIVRDVKFVESTTGICPTCSGNGKCRNCLGKGKVAKVSGLGRRSGSSSRKLGGSLKNTSSQISCPVCRGTGRCRQCGGRGEVVRPAAVPVADKEDIHQKWQTQAEQARRLVLVRCGTGKALGGLGKLQQLLKCIPPPARNSGEDR